MHNQNIIWSRLMAMIAMFTLAMGITACGDTAIPAATYGGDNDNGGTGGSNNATGGSNNGGGTGNTGNQPISCSGGQVSCNGTTCTNLNTDSANCGTCGLTCSSNQSCQAGHCANKSPTNTCTPSSTPETCNQVDDNCNGVIDEGFTLTSDDSHCGICGNACPSGASCISSHCTWDNPVNTCTASAEICNQIDDDCDGVIDDGINLNTDATNCGVCGHSCPNGASCSNGHCKWNVPVNGCTPSAEVCNNTDDDCDGNIDNGFLLTSDPLNCGTCGHACAAGQFCSAGHCAWTTPKDNCTPSAEVCDNVDNDCDGTVDEDFNLLNDEANCGLCGRACPAGATCVNAVCTNLPPLDKCIVQAPEVCDNVDNDCNGLIDEPFNLLSDINNCGSCGHVCPAATQYCSNGHCANLVPASSCTPVAETCNDRDDDCDGLIDNGFNTQNDEANCGSCGTTCAANQSCLNGHCAWDNPQDSCVPVAEVCDDQDNNCNKTIDETFNKTTDSANCGVCGRVCLAGQTCVNAKCTWTTPQSSCIPAPAELCNNIDDDCDGVVDNGFNLSNDVNNCGVCGHACPAGSTCIGSHCQNTTPVNNCAPVGETCNNTDDDCDGVIDNGFVLSTDKNNCGSCGVVCAAGQTCQNGKCGWSNPVNVCVPAPETCNQVDDNCNGGIDEGINLLLDNANCGVCGHVCVAGQHCQNGKCALDIPASSCVPVAETCNFEDDDCDGFVDEIFNTNTDKNNCGLCGIVCAAGQHCANAHCVLDVPANGCVPVAETCNNQDDDCDGVIDNPFVLASDPNNCGTCGHICPGGSVCQNGKCALIVPINNCNPAPAELCNNTDDDCDGVVDEDFNLNVDPANCGQCGHTCAPGQTCVGAHCAWVTPIASCVAAIEVCDNVDNDCDGTVDEGFNLATDKLNCGLCGNACAAGQFCSNGHCALIIPSNSCVPVAETCNSSDDNCNGVIDENFNLSSDKLNCGSCGNVCGAGQFCQGGKCTLVVPIVNCTPVAETCNGVDDDCDGVIDETYNLANDKNNCGSCGNACAPGQNCVASHCSWISPVNTCVPVVESCNNTDDDCDGVIDNPFVLASDNNNCGTCGHVCPGGTVCQNAKCTNIAPVNGCNPAPAELCNNADDDCDGVVDEDFNLNVDPANCGQCGKACAPGQTCQAAHCAWTAPVNGCISAPETCNGVDDDCDGSIDETYNLANDPANCGTCGNVCGAGKTCQNGHCAWVSPVVNCVAAIEVCDNVDNDCDGLIDEPFNLASDKNNCGACGNACAAGQFCSAGHCAWVTPVATCVAAPETCNNVDDDCDGLIDENTILANDPLNCGTCGYACPGGTICQGGKCAYPIPVNGCNPAPAELCNNADDDCDGWIDEDFNLNVDPANCGQCGKACAVGQTCVAAHCAWIAPVSSCVAAPEACDNEDNDCDGTIDEGFNLASDKLNCGVCGHNCGAGRSCQNGKCINDSPVNSCVAAPEVCDNIDNNCNLVIDEGFNLSSNAQNCGMCGRACAVGQYCTGGTCAWITPINNCVVSVEICDGKDNDCDGLVDEGFNFSSDPLHCGSCSIVCQAGKTCFNGVCQLKVLDFPSPEADLEPCITRSRRLERLRAKSSTPLCALLTPTRHDDLSPDQRPQKPHVKSPPIHMDRRAFSLTNTNLDFT